LRQSPFSNEDNKAGASVAGPFYKKDRLLSLLRAILS